jgi:hypothetical protein
MATQSVQQVVDYLKAHPEVAQIDTAALTRDSAISSRTS